MINTIKRRPAIETPDERDLRLKALALMAKINPLLGKFYARPDTVSDNIERNLSQVNISRLNAAYNKMREGGSIDDKEKQVILGVIKAAILMNFKPLKDFLGDEKYGAFVLMLSQKFVDQYEGAKFKVPEEMAVELGDDGKGKEEGKDGDDAEKKPDEEEAEGDSGGKSEDGEGDGSDGEEGDSADGEGDDGKDDLESESADTKAKGINYIDAPTLIVIDLIKYFQKMRWADISKRLVQIKEAKGFESKSADDIVNTRLTFRVSRKQRHKVKHMVNLYEIVLNGKAVGLIHSLQDEDNGFNKRIWMVVIRNHFNDASYRSGFSPTEPFTIVKRNNIVLHNPIPSTMHEARAWVRVALER